MILQAMLCLPVLAASDPGAYSLLTDVAVGPDGDVYVADPGRRRIVCASERWGPARVVFTFDPAGPARWPSRLAVGPGGALYVSDPGAHAVFRADLDTGELERVAGTGVPGFDRDGPATEVPLASPAGLAFGPSGVLFIADLGNRAVRAVDLEAGTIATVAGGWDSTRTEFRDGFFHMDERVLPSDLATAPDGSLLVLDLLGREVLRLAAGGEGAAEIPGSSNRRATGDTRVDSRIAARRDFAVGPKGELLFAEGSAGRVSRLAPDAEATTVFAERGLKRPSAVAVDAKGRAFVVDSDLGVMLRVDLETGESARLYRSETPPPDRFEEEPLEVLRAEPDPAAVPDPAVRSAIAASGHPWSVRHRATGIELRLVPAGRYVRGARSAEEDVRGDARPPHEVRIPRPIYVSRTEVTNRQYRTLDPNHASLLSAHHDLVEGLDGVTFDGDAQPATNLCWYDAADFAARWGFRLPTEAEWEYLARAGAETVYPWGDELEGGAPYANLAGPAVAERIALEVHVVPFDDGHLVTAPVGSLLPNGFGLHDAIGNVWEWCADWHAYDEYERCAEGVEDPRGPAEGTSRILRGGSWQTPFQGSSRLSFRGLVKPTAHHVLSRGVRVVLDP